MLLLSVLVLGCLHVSHGRRLSDVDIDNDVAPAPGATSTFAERMEDWVKISAPPTPVISKMFGDYVELECEAMGSPPPTIHWRKGKKQITEIQSYDTNLISESPSQGLAKVKSRIVIHHVLPIHSGRFSCVAESGSQSATAETTVHVTKKEGYDRNFTQLLKSKILGEHYEPRVTLFAPTYMDVIGTNIVLPCQTIGNPKPTTMWIDPQGQIVGEGEGRVSMLPDGELSIRALSWADMGVYNCVARNMIGDDAAETFLYPMKPSK